MLLSIILANLVVGIIGILGAFLIIKFFQNRHDSLLYLVSFAAGSMIAVSFFDLIPEAIEKHGNLMAVMEFLVLGFILFMLIEKAFIFYHCHEENCQVHSSIKLVMIGDTIHNILDGVAIAASFLAGNTIGLFTTLAIIIHEIPQEVGDFGVLLHGGYSKTKALLSNFGSAVGAILGGIVAFFTLNYFSSYLPYVLAITAGGFIYISAADLLPEMHRRGNTRTKIFFHSLVVILGVIVMWLLGKMVRE
ncbi:MAG: ZIP family metal transporter [Candidatus Magasanikbacteria bacterium]|nr:ZIP family metal transporter [Candidatus Magasanikbacteria bacterium]